MNEVNQVTRVVTDGRLPVVHTLTESLTYDGRGNRTGSVTTRTTGGTTHVLARVDNSFDGMDQLVGGVHDFGANLNNAKDDQTTTWVRDGLGRALTVTDNGVSHRRVFDRTAVITDGATRVTYGPDGRTLSEAFETVEGSGRNAHTVTVTRDVLADVIGAHRRSQLPASLRATNPLPQPLSGQCRSLCELVDTHWTDALRARCDGREQIGH